jgi:hypothetical protein
MSSSTTESKLEGFTAFDAHEHAIDCGLVLIRIVQPATATPPIVRAGSTSLSVLGEDVLGESLLHYTWRVASSPAGSQVSFSKNGSNSAKNTTATFSLPGSYALFCTVTNGLFGVASNLEVLVEKTLTQLAA